MRDAHDENEASARDPIMRDAHDENEIPRIFAVLARMWYIAS